MTGMKILFALLLVTGGVIRWNRVQACDFCARDQAGAVYSYRNRRIASESNSTFVSVKINGIHSDEKFIRLEKRLQSIPGIVPGTIKISRENLTASFVFTSATSWERITSQVAMEDHSISLERIPEIPESGDAR